MADVASAALRCLVVVLMWLMMVGTYHLRTVSMHRRPSLGSTSSRSRHSTRLSCNEHIRATHSIVTQDVKGGDDGGVVLVWVLTRSARQDHRSVTGRRARVRSSSGPSG